MYIGRDVAQFGSAFALGAKGRRFKSYHPENVFSSGVERRFPKPNVVGSNPTRRVPSRPYLRMVEVIKNDLNNN